MIRLLESDDVNQIIQSLTGQSVCLNDASAKIEESVKTIIETVRNKGDAGVQEVAAGLRDFAVDRNAMEWREDTNPSGCPFRLNEATIKERLARVDRSVKVVLDLAAERIRTFAQAVKKGLGSAVVDCGEFQTGLEYRPVRRVACYVPGGRYPLPSTALMTAVTAQAAGVAEIVIVSPRLEDEIIYAGTLAGVKEFYQIGGAQAIAAMACGTSTISPVDMIVGPGNAYVTEAKRQLQGVVGIDMLAGPSEICVIADSTANADWVALDLLSQAEHDPDARAYLLTTSKELAEQVTVSIEKSVKELNLPEFIRESLGQSAIIVLGDLELCVRVADQIAPEHLLLAIESADVLKERVTNYGALFMGYGCTVAFGDYMAGPNHTLPTNRSARFQGCLTPLTFLRSQSWVRVKSQAPRLAADTAAFAELEGLTAHAAAANIRNGIQGSRLRQTSAKI